MSDWNPPPQRQPPFWLTASLLLVTLVASIWFVDFVTESGERLEGRRVQALATTAAASLLPSQVATLQGVPSDIGTSTLAQVRQHLQRIHAVNPDFRFVYLMRPDGAGRAIFLADAEAEISDQYSRPGDVYDGPAENILQVYASGNPAVEPPARDRWGYWVTGLAPVRATDSDQIVAVLGMDMSAADWLAARARYRSFALIISGLALTLVVIFLIGTRMQQRSRLHIETINARLGHELSELARAQEDLRLADVVVRNTEEGVMVLGADRAIQSVNPAFERITGFSQVEVLGQNPRLLAGVGADRPGFIETIHAELEQRGKWEGTLPAQRKSGEDYPQETTVNLVRNTRGEIQHYAVVFRDATQQKQLEDRLRLLSATDGLTQVPNRRLFDETLQREWNRALRDGAPLTLIMADLDHFKPYNDRYGHVAGDECLKQVAAAMQASLHRAGDFVARYGGEEFAIILPATDPNHAREIAEKVRHAVRLLAIVHEENSAANVVTVSLGCASIIPDHADDGVSLVEAADRALYQAKRGGRDRVVAAAT